MSSAQLFFDKCEFHFGTMRKFQKWMVGRLPNSVNGNATELKMVLMVILHDVQLCPEVTQHVYDKAKKYYQSDSKTMSQK